MTLYLITELYPLDENDTSMTHALRDFAEAWDAEVIVFRPLQLGISYLKRIRSYSKLIRQSPKPLGSRPVVFFPLLKIPFVRKYIYRIRKRLVYPPPSFIVGHSLMGNYLAMHLSKTYGVPFSAGLHAYDVFKLMKEKKQYEPVLRQSSLIACRSHPILKQLHELSGNRYSDKAFVAHSGIEEEQVEELSLFVSKARELNQGKLRFVTASRLLKLKHIDINIQVLAGMKFDFSYTIIGEGPERKKLQKLIDEHGVSDKIEILGWKTRAEVLEHFRNADIFIMVSAPETFGLAYLEAMAKGCLVIGAHGWGIDGIIQDGRNGYLAEPGDARSLEHIIHEILALPAGQREVIWKATRESILKMTRRTSRFPSIT